MTTTIRFHGISTYEVAGPYGRVLMDPFIAGNPVAPVPESDIADPDVISISHAAWDHMSSAAPIAKRSGCTVVCGTDTAALLAQSGVPESQLRRTTWGIRIKVGDLIVKPVHCAHWSSATLKNGTVINGVPMAFVVETEPGISIYHFGDSAISTEMTMVGRLHQPTVGLLGVTQPWSLVLPGGGEVVTGEMSPHEAALAAEMLGVRYAIATHYEDSDHPDVKEFLAAVPLHDSTGNRVGLALKPGQTLILDDADHYRVEDP
jgi:L-ascorbate metabolism protein UlaG (beta-lactamase superfamily)